MGLSATDKKVIGAELGEEVEQFLEDFTQDWQAAGEYALMNASDPQEDDSDRYWWFALAGNMLWAATAFFPGGGVIQQLEKGVAKVAVNGVTKYMPMIKEFPSNWPTATRAASLLGAAAGSNVIGMAAAVASGKWSLANAKFQMTRQLASQRGGIKEAFVNGATAWVNKTLLPRALAKAGIQDGDGATRDSAVIQILGTSQRDERRSFTWGNYIFPSSPAYTANPKERSTALGEYMKDQIEEALKNFDRQWREYQRANVWAGQARRPPFKATLAFKGVPSGVQPTARAKVPGDLLSFQ
jgi:hypothetical protein